MLKYCSRKGVVVALIGLCVPALVCAHAAKRLDVRVSVDGVARWVRVASDSPADPMGRIGYVLIGGQRLTVEATRHSEGERSVTVDRVVAGDDLGAGASTAVAVEELVP